MSFDETYDRLRDDLLRVGASVNTSQWQSQSDTPETETIELQFVTVMYEIPVYIDALVSEVKPNLPWAEAHFLERVSGIPYNPPPSAKDWPFARRDHEEHTDSQGKFSHTYPERMWGDHYAIHPWYQPPDRRTDQVGDLHDLVDLLCEYPGTRQAYLPIWWPVDGMRAGKERVPCTLGYHFLIRDGEMHCHYFMRSCDFLRHFRDDVYMAARLTQWLCNRINYRMDRELRPCRLVMPISSLHVFAPDLHTMKYHMKIEAQS